MFPHTDKRESALVSSLGIHARQYVVTRRDNQFILGEIALEAHMMKFLTNVYTSIIRGGNALQHPLLLAIRLTWGWQFFITGKGKLLNQEHVAQYFASLGIPFPALNAWFVSGLECFGGLLLLAGLGSRAIALLLSIDMIVAYLSVAEDRAKVFHVFQNPDPFFQADPFLFLYASLIVLAFGPGLISVDALIARFLKRGSIKPEGQKPESTSRPKATAAGS
jgi:putative oxidoreductase